MLYHGSLSESCDASRGDTFFEGAPGVYLHGQDNAHKAEFYIVFVDLFQDSVFWAAKFECLVDRKQAVKPKSKTDQGVQPTSSVKLVALHI